MAPFNMSKEKTLCRKMHHCLLARPMKHKVSRKYKPLPDHVFKNIKRPVEPLNNKRLHMLAEPNRFRRTQKWVEPDLPSTCVSRAALEATATARLDHISRPFVRVLQAIRSEREHYGKTYTDMMNERINMSLDTIYYHNVKSLMQNEQQKLKSREARRKTVVKIKTFETCGDRERLAILATAKRRWPPKRGPKRKWKDIYQFDRLPPLAVPYARKCYRRPSQDSLVLESRRRLEEATKYVVSPEILKLFKLPDWKLQPVWVPTGISRAALKYEISDNVKKLAEPAARSQAVESDVRENAFEVSKAAMLYKATPRILDLAKPKERK